MEGSALEDKWLPPSAKLDLPGRHTFEGFGARTVSHFSNERWRKRIKVILPDPG